MIDDTPESEIYEMVLGDHTYLTIDRENGLILTVFNLPAERNMMQAKFDMISIAYKRNQQIVNEKRTIIEVVNENTIIIDRPFPDLELLPEYIFDFKNIHLENKNSPDFMTIAER